MTKQFAVIGDPISHSLSPAIHNALYRQYGMDAAYQTIQIPQGELATRLPTILEQQTLTGFNVTMPHKQGIIPLLSGISKEAVLARSVNTVCVKEDGLHGHTTDAQGFVRAIAETGRNLAGMPIVFLGAGSVCGALALHWSSQQKGPVTIVARNPAKAESLAKNLRQQSTVPLTILAWNKENLQTATKNAPLLVNTTPLGMAGNQEDFEDFSFLRHLPKQALVYDLIYQPRQTTLLKAATEMGYQTANGVDMLIYQAMEAFHLFFETTTTSADKTMILEHLSQQGLL